MMDKINLDICRRCFENKLGDIRRIRMDIVLNSEIQVRVNFDDGETRGVLTKTQCNKYCQYKLEHMLTGYPIKNVNGIAHEF